jgi:hypothetical protein
MYCPNCGSEERQRSQYCRVCGTDLRVVRDSLDRPDSITASAVSARDEIGRAIAAKIKELQTASDLAEVAEEVLPEIEKFLESPQERRLRRLRAGVIIALIGLGAALFFLLMSINDEDVIFLTALGVTAFLIGLGIVINGLLFTVPRQSAEAHSLPDKHQPSTFALPGAANTSEELPTARQMPLPPASVTENTTYRLPGEQTPTPTASRVGPVE